jgi:hypothetical protein
MWFTSMAKPGSYSVMTQFSGWWWILSFLVTKNIVHLVKIYFWTVVLENLSIDQHTLCTRDWRRWLLHHRLSSWWLDPLSWLSSPFYWVLHSLLWQCLHYRVHHGDLGRQHEIHQFFNHQIFGNGELCFASWNEKNICVCDYLHLRIRGTMIFSCMKSSQMGSKHRGIFVIMFFSYIESCHVNENRS